MIKFKKNKLILKHDFDPVSCRHYLNSHVVVIHCHHYTALYTQLAIDAGETSLLQDVAENNFYPFLVEYFDDNEIDNFEDRIEIGSMFYSAMGLGKLEITCIGEYSGEAVVSRSHIDEGWLKKWGQYNKPVNYIGAGFITALFSAVLDIPKGGFKITEIQSIVMGAKKSIFNIVKI